MIATYYAVFLLAACSILSNNVSANTNSSQKRPTECRNIDPLFVKCEYKSLCVYGETIPIQCEVPLELHCQGERKFMVDQNCLYCWQLPEDAYTCVQNSTCKTNTRYLTTCNVNSTTYCLGRRMFNKYKQCHNVTGHNWSTTLVLSVLFGGFGVDRFYLGHWQEGVGKLFSFGGFGIWTLVDTTLIAIGYLKPADSSHYEL